MQKSITIVAAKTILAAALIAALAPAAVGAQPPQSAAAQNDPAVRWLPATPQKLPRWRGFNLLEKFHLGGGRKPFLEEDFRLIAKLGFNFVRLPMDYRFWIVPPKGTGPLKGTKGTVPFSSDENRDSPRDENRDSPRQQFDEATLREIDQAIEWGRRYGVHVCICFHRAPGYTVAEPPEKTNLWTDPQPQRACAAQWAMFARRYRGIPNERLSFNLVNEPGHVEPKVYAAVVGKLAAAIRAEDPRRLIIADGLEWGRLAVPELAPLHVAEATRGYTPMELSHYQAAWVHGERFPRPQWPRPVPPNGTLLSPAKAEGSHPLVIDGPFAADTELRLHVLTVSMAAGLVVEADGRRIFRKQFRCGPGAGEWRKAVFQPQYRVYQNLFDRDYRTTVPAGTRQVRVRVADGDWLEIGQIGLRPAAGGKEDVLALRQEFGAKSEPFRYAPGARAALSSACPSRIAPGSGRPASSPGRPSSRGAWA